MTRDEINSIMKQGASAYNAGRKIDTNPYSKYSDQWKTWRRGYANERYGASIKVNITKEKNFT